MPTATSDYGRGDRRPRPGCRAHQRARPLHGRLRDLPPGHGHGAEFASLPGGRCQCPHWGTLLNGRVVVHYEDHDEVIEAGEPYYMAPGHVPEIDAGTELLMFSPTDEVAATNAAIQAAMQPS